MKNVRTVQYEELSEDQIKAARMRRSRDRCRPHICLLYIPIQTMSRLGHKTA